MKKTGIDEGSGTDKGSGIDMSPMNQATDQRDSNIVLSRTLLTRL